MIARRLATLALGALLIAAAPGAGFRFGDWNVNTSVFNFNWDTGAFSAPNHVVLTRPGSTIVADRASGNQKQNQATLSGHVVLHDDNGILTKFAAGSSKSATPATLTCDQLQIDGTTKTYTAIGNVHYAQGTSQVSADRAVMNGVTHDIHLSGNVHLIQ